MSSTVGAVRLLRVHVEPIEVEVDEDGAIAWTSLQTAFPGCSGLYYKGAECKGAVKFDGKKFLSPGGAWNDRNYYVSLGSRCHAPFGSYENASKQFERSVTAVQRMLGSSLFEMPARRSVRSSKSSRVVASDELTAAPAGENDSNTPVPTAPIPRADSLPGEVEPFIERIEHHRHVKSERKDGDIIAGIQEREKLLKSAPEKLSPIEQQFIDLARISTGKDAIIDGQREELKKEKELVENVNKKFTSMETELSACKERLGAQEEELSLLRGMSAGQMNTNEKVQSLSMQLLAKDDELSNCRGEHARRVAELSQENLQVKERVAELSQENRQVKERNEILTSELDKARNSADLYRIEAQKLDSDQQLLEAELGVLREIRDELRIESPEMATKWRQRMESLAKSADDHEKLKTAYERIETQHHEIQELSSKLTDENSRLMTRNRELTERVEKFEQEFDVINQKWKETTKEKEQIWEEMKITLEKDLEAKRRELEEVQATLSTVASDAATNAQRISELEHSRDELRRLLDANEYKFQEPLKRQIRTLSDELSESQERCKQLNSLVTNLTSDARNSQQDVTDFYYGASRI
ncbi:unnamed protein product, partial [Mesorhabditis belari]|uniref:TAR DNA-binding protein 43 N-terminal domain-containing protein n=1 Tax=Mesorhabditis belari TaxID=2138241 RepID=A0AAF3FJD7_9BILA